MLSPIEVTYPSSRCYLGLLPPFAKPVLAVMPSSRLLSEQCHWYALSATFCLYQYEHIRPGVCTICYGMAASMGDFLLGASAKGKRSSLLSSQIVIHQPSGGAHGQAVDIEIQAKEILYLKQ